MCHLNPWPVVAQRDHHSSAAPSALCQVQHTAAPVESCYLALHTVPRVHPALVQLLSNALQALTAGALPGITITGAPQLL